MWKFVEKNTKCSKIFELLSKGAMSQKEFNPTGELEEIENEKVSSILRPVSQFLANLGACECHLTI